MVGMIVTGHGSFASGITSGLKLLAGELQDYQPVDFTPEDSVDSLTQKLSCALDELQGCDGVLIFADLAGGSPFNVSVRLKMERKQEILVIGGANLPSVLNAFMTREMSETAEKLASDSLIAGKDAMVCFTGSSDEDNEYEE